MGQPLVIIFTPTHEEYRAVADALMGSEFSNFKALVAETGPGVINTALGVAARLTETGAEKPLALLGAGSAGSLSLKLKAGDTIFSDSVLLGDWAMETDYARTHGVYGAPAYRALTGEGPPPEMALVSASPLVREWGPRLASKGFRPGRLLTSDTYYAGLSVKLEQGRLFGCPAADSESGALALAAERHGLPWANIRVAADTIDESLRAEVGDSPDIREVLALKVLVALSTLDQMPQPSSCGSCGSPCGILKRL